jgi:Holliday junction resolvase RusA-like endonuclease
MKPKQCKICKKPLSVNQAWQGKRFKTKEYEAYEKELLFTLPKISMPLPPFEIDLHFGFSNKKADIDNPVKPFLDIMQKKYKFNDCDIYKLNLQKSIVKKGFEFIEFTINTI